MQPIGVFDSGIGGVSVLRAVRAALPGEDIIYYGDNAHLPYGEKTLEQVQVLSEDVVRFLLAQHCKLIIIACHTASAAALEYLRARYPDVPFIGMEPAVKPAAEQTCTGVVGVLATSTTLKGTLFAHVVDRFAQRVQVYAQACPGLVDHIEKGELETPETEAMLRTWLAPMQQAGVDQLVLACTHYPFVRPLLEKILGDGVTIIDPAPAVAQQVTKVLEEKHLLSSQQNGTTSYYTSGDPKQFAQLLTALTGETTVVYSSTKTQP